MAEISADISDNQNQPELHDVSRTFYLYFNSAENPVPEHTGAIILSLH